MLEKFYSAFGVKPKTLKKWFTPGQGPKVTLLRGMKKDEGMWDPIRGARVDADKNPDLKSRISTTIHELTHRMQFRKARFKPSSDLDYPPDLAAIVRQAMISRKTKPSGAHFWAFAIEVYLFGKVP